jgi:hypothetical protein
MHEAGLLTLQRPCCHHCLTLQPRTVHVSRWGHRVLLLPLLQVEVLGDPDVQQGGSRPVGQVTRGLDRLGELLR